MKKIASIFIFFCFGCGGASKEDAKNLCDGSDDLVLAIRSDHRNFLPERGGLYFENGRNFIYLNGKCEFWSYGYIPKSIANNYGLRIGIKTGALDENQTIELLDMLNWTDWEELDDTYYFQSSPNVSFSSKESTFGISFPRAVSNTDGEGEIRLDVVNGFTDALKYLYSIGGPIDKGNLRVSISETIEDDWWDIYSTNVFLEWPLEKRLISELATKPQSVYCFGTSFLISGKAADELRAERTAYRKIADQEPTKAGVLDEEGGRHLFYIRDVLPFENKIGLVPLDGEFDEVFCQHE